MNEVIRRYVVETGSKGKVSITFDSDAPKKWIVSIGKFTASGDDFSQTAHALLYVLNEAVKTRRRYHAEQLRQLDELLE